MNLWKIILFLKGAKDNNVNLICCNYDSSKKKFKM